MWPTTVSRQLITLLPLHAPDVECVTLSTPSTVTAVLRSQGVQFVRLFQGALRLVRLYSTDHAQVRAAIDRFLAPLNKVLKATPTLTVSFQFDNVVLNSVPVSDATLAPLAGELVRRRVGFLEFSQGVDYVNLARMLTVLAAKPEKIDERGGIERYLRDFPIERARIVPLQTNTSGGSVAVLTTADEASAIGKIPRWLLKAVQDLQTGGETDVATSVDLSALSAGLRPNLTPDQSLLLPQLRNLLARVVQRANAAVLSELIRSAVEEAGVAGEELLKSVLVHVVNACVESRNIAQAERILRFVSLLGLKPAGVLKMIGSDKLDDEMRTELTQYVAWLEIPLDEQLDRLNEGATEREFRWLMLDIELAEQQNRQQAAGDLLLAVYAAMGPPGEAERADVLTRSGQILARFCASGLPHNAQSLIDDISVRLRDEESSRVVKPLVESLGILAQAATDRQLYSLATTAVGAIQEIAGELTPRGRIARQMQRNVLKPATLGELARDAVFRKDDVAVTRTILPLLKKIGDPAARVLLDMLENEHVAAKRMRILRVVRMLGRSALAAVSERLLHPQWYMVRNALSVLADLADPMLLDRIEPAMSHPDERVQLAAVEAARKTRSSLRAMPLARALLALTPAALDVVLDDLLVLKDAKTVPYIETLVRFNTAEIKPAIFHKAIAVLWAIGTNDVAEALARIAADTGVAVPLRDAAAKAAERLSTSTVDGGPPLSDVH